MNETKDKGLNRFWFIWNLVETILLLAGGVLSIVAGILATKEDAASSVITAENGIAYLIAGFALLDGVLRVILFLAKYKQGADITPLLVSAFEITVGTLFILLQINFKESNIFTFTVANLIAILLMVTGALLLTLAIFFIVKKKAKVFVPILEIVFAAVLIGVGVLIEVLYNTDGERERLVLIMTGIIVTLAAIAMFVTLLINQHKLRKGTATVGSNLPANVPQDGMHAHPDAEPQPAANEGDVIEVEARDAEEAPAIEGPKPKRLGNKKK